MQKYQYNRRMHGTGLGIRDNIHVFGVQGYNKLSIQLCPLAFLYVCLSDQQNTARNFHVCLSKSCHHHQLFSQTIYKDSLMYNICCSKLWRLHKPALLCMFLNNDTTSTNIYIKQYIICVSLILKGKQALTRKITGLWPYKYLLWFKDTIHVTRNIIYSLCYRCMIDSKRYEFAV